MKAHTETPIRMDRTLQEHIHDPYKMRSKLPEPAICPQCGAVYHKGRWQWGEAPSMAHEALCQACHRTNDQHPAGILTLRGNFLAQHREEIIQLCRHAEKSEKSEHPLNRIMNLEDQADTLVITTTDIHLPRRIGEALENAYKGDLDFHYDEAAYFIRVNWKRE